MVNYCKNVTVDHSLKNIFALILDVESYPEFIPYIKSWNIASETEGEMMVETTISSTFFEHLYISKITYKISDLEAKITINSSDQIVKSLVSEWKLGVIDSSITNINFNITIDLHSNLLYKILQKSIINLGDKIFTIFKNRADIIYKNHDSRKR
jgi:coenzyme Q-binding protein COQ10